MQTKKKKRNKDKKIMFKVDLCHAATRYIGIYDEATIEWIDSVFKGFNAELEFTDNHRAALVGDFEAERRYDNAAASGCCGYHDVEMTDPNGRVFRMGCNYGH